MSVSGFTINHTIGNHASNSGIIYINTPTFLTTTMFRQKDSRFIGKIVDEMIQVTSSEKCLRLCSAISKHVRNLQAIAFQCKALSYKYWNSFRYSLNVHRFSNILSHTTDPQARMNGRGSCREYGDWWFPINMT